MISSAGLEMPQASAATSASRIAVSARPKRLLRDVDRHPGADRRDGEAEIVEAPLGIERRREDCGPGTPMPPPVTLCQASAICVTMVAKPSVVIAK